MNPKLKEQMEKAAKEHAHNCFPSNWGGKDGTHEVHLQNQRDSFLAGSTWMADKYAPLVKALKEIVVEGELGGSGTDADIALKALQEIGEDK